MSVLLMTGVAAALLVLELLVGSTAVATASFLGLPLPHKALIPKPPSQLQSARCRAAVVTTTTATAATNTNTNDWAADDWSQSLPNNNDDDHDDDDSSRQYDNAFQQQPQQRKLGIDIGAMLDPLTAQDAAELKAAATEIIHDAVAAGLDEIRELRDQMQEELTRQSQQRQVASEIKARQVQHELLSKIDTLTDTFLASTASSRDAMKLAATADQAAIGQGVELGTWGMVDGNAVVTATTGRLGGTSPNVGQSPSSQGLQQPQQPPNRIIVLADTATDPYAKQLLEPLMAALKSELNDHDLHVTVYKPTATVPLGGDNAATALLFCTSFTDSSSVTMVLDRLLRKTMQAGGAIGQPPTQVVAISTIGTCRIEKMPYSMQNLMGGGKLEKRRQMEEAIVRIARDSTRGTTALDYTICHLGDLKADTKEAFAFRAGDAVDGSLAIDTAVAVLTHAIALQPTARNSTFSCVGKLPENDGIVDGILDDAFLRLDGPELLRFDLADSDHDYGPLAEYIKGWAEMLAQSTGQGLTTPVRYEVVPARSFLPTGVARHSAVKLLFKPTATGKDYSSKDDERKSEREGPSSTGSNVVRMPKTSNEGGVEFLVEMTVDNKLRARARRCNYGDDTIVKELSEETIMSRFRKGIEVWKKDHQKS